MATATTANQYRELILAELGEQDGTTGPVSSNIIVLWNTQEEYAGGSLHTQYLLTKKKGLEITIGSIMRGEYRRFGNLQNDDLTGRLTMFRDLLEDTKKELLGKFSLSRLNLDFLEPDLNY